MENLFYTPLDEALFKRRIVQISGGVNSALSDRVCKLLLAMEASDPKAPVTLFINSPGGEINSGFAIYDTARFIEPAITTLVCGLAASMGSLIALCAEKKNRLAMPNSKFLIHQPLIGGVIQGAATDIQIHARDLSRVKERINQLYAKETGRPLDEIRTATDRDNWMTAEEALEFGLVSRIISSRAELK